MSNFHDKWRDVKGPRFKAGDRVRIPHKTLGHDNHDPQRVYVVESSRPASYDGFHKIKGLVSTWPGTRLESAQ